MNIIKKLFLYLLFSFLLITCSKQESATEQTIKIFLVAPAGTKYEGKKIGCDDVLIPVSKEVKIEKTSIETALDELINAKDTDELKNYVKGPQLILAQVMTAGGMTDVYLKGDFQINGVCDIPRIQEQINETIKQLSDLKKVNIYINNQTLASYLKIAAKGF